MPWVGRDNSAQSVIPVTVMRHNDAQSARFLQVLTDERLDSERRTLGKSLLKQGCCAEWCPSSHPIFDINDAQSVARSHIF